MKRMRIPRALHGEASSCNPLAMRGWGPAIVLLAGLGAPGCLAVPYTPTVDLERVPASGAAFADAYVSIGPRQLLEDMENGLADADGRIELHDALAFRDMAFPDGNWTLDRLRTAETLERLRSLQVDYAVLVGPQHLEEDLHADCLIPLLGGLILADVQVQGSAVILDLERGELDQQALSEANGRGIAVGLFIYSLWFLPLTHQGATRGLAQAVAERLGELEPGVPLEVVVLALETSAAVDESQGELLADRARGG